ncbi:unnamed protein product [Cunninghamella blakesleeana]
MRPQAFNTPLRAVWKVANNLTETFWWPSKTTDFTNKKKTVLLFSPGNPGLASWYIPFLDKIHNNSFPTLEIVAVSHLGHSVGPHNENEPKRIYGLQEQIDHKIACFDQLKKENEHINTQYILMGHSVGSYLCSEVLKHRQHDNEIIQLIALFPALREIALTPNGVNITKLVNRVPHSLISGVAGLTQFISDPIREFITKIITGQKGHCLKITSHDLLNKSVIDNVLFMAQQEMEQIKELDHDFYQTHVDRFIMYYSKVDEWAPLDHYEFMSEKFPKATIYLCAEDIPHAFILEDKHADYMADKVIGWILPLE